MTLPVVTWVLELKPSEKTTFELTNVADLKITNATLDPVLEDETGRSTVVLHILSKSFEDSDEEEDEDGEKESDASSESPPQKLVLTSLTPGKIESSIHDIVVTRPATVVCEVIGKNTIHLSGYLYVPENEAEASSDGGYPAGEMNFDEDSESDDEDYMYEMEHDLEPNESELGDMVSEMRGLLRESGRLEEVDEDEEEGDAPVHASPAKSVEASKKRQRESDDEEPAPTLSKKERKKLKAQQAAAEAGKGDAPPQKKQKAEDGKPVPISATGKKEKDGDGKKPNGEEAKKDKKEKDKGKNVTNGTDGKDVAKTTKLPNGLSISDAKVGTGATAKKGSRLSMRYIGKLASGKVFDSNTSGKPFKFQLGKGDVIKGWDEGLVGMKVGGERHLVIPPHLGYGKQKVSGIPPNSTLMFEVKMLEIS